MKGPKTHRAPEGLLNIEQRPNPIRTQEVTSKLVVA